MNICVSHPIKTQGEAAQETRLYVVQRRRRETIDTVTVELVPQDGGDPPPFAAGQFNMLSVFGVGEIPKPAVEVVPRAAVGYGCTEAPRGILYHRYRINELGEIQEAKIVPPTSQNQKSIEIDLKTFASQVLHLPEELFVQRCEQAIRNYDPCISCSTHFLRLNIEPLS
jgi:hypothetical protein